VGRICIVCATLGATVLHRSVNTLIVTTGYPQEGCDEEVTISSIGDAQYCFHHGRNRHRIRVIAGA
jgi:hypothetical protein